MTHFARHSALAAGLLAALIAGAGTAGAVDGVIEINSARVSKGGITPGDTPGFPITISTGAFAADPMSFRLTGPLFTSTSGNIIEVLSPNVSIDLNGFTIGCLLPSCSGKGISSDQDNISVSNGTVKGFAEGISLTGTSARIEHVRATGNALGLHAGNSCTVRDDIANSNTAEGMKVGIGCLVTGNVASFNGSDGICTLSSTNVIGNTAVGNTGFGLDLASGAGYSQNVINNNTAGTVHLGVATGSNICDGDTTCP